MSAGSLDAATTPRHPATEKAWAWLVAEDEIMALDPMLLGGDDA